MPQAGKLQWVAERARLASRPLAAAIALLMAIAAPAHAGDNFTGTGLSGTSGSVTSSSSGTSGQSGEPTTYGGGSLNTVWYSWTAPATGDVTFQTCGGSTNFDTTLQVFTGTAVNALAMTATNDDDCGLQSRVRFVATAGITYRIQVDGFGNEAGTFTLSWTLSSASSAPTGTQACTALSGAWSGNATTSGTIGVSRAVTGTNTMTWDPQAADSLNTINAFSTTAAQGSPSAVETVRWNSPTPISGAIGTYTITFAKPVTNPVLHLDRWGGVTTTNRSNTTRFRLTSGGTIVRLSGPSHFEVWSDNSILRTPDVATTNNAESSLTSANGTAAGSVMIQGTHSVVVFEVTGISPQSGVAGDQVELAVCVPQADLSLTKTVNNASPALGANVTFTLTLTNAGPQDAPNVQVTDLLPAGLTFVAAVASQGTYVSGTGIWSLGTVANGASPTLQIVATATTTGSVTNNAQVTASGLADPDSNPGDGSGDDFSSATVNVQPVGDLALNFSPFTGTALHGFPVSVSLNVVNQGALAMNGVAVSFPVPTGYVWVSDTAGGNYNPSTGVLTIGAVATGQTITRSFVFVPLATGSYAFVAEISAASAPDSDSTPANAVTTEDDYATLTLSPVAGTGGTISPPVCASGVTSLLDWATQSWPQGDRTRTLTVGSTSVQFSIADPAAALDMTPFGPMPILAPYFLGGLPVTEPALNFETRDAVLSSNAVTITIGFAAPISGLRFRLFDIDYNLTAGAHRFERADISGSLGGSPVVATLSGGSALSITGQTAIGVADSPDFSAGSQNGTLAVAFDSPVDQITIVITNSAGTNRTDGFPGLSLHDLSWCAPPLAQLAASKSISLLDPAGYSIPGADVIYAITVANVGTGPTDADSIVLIDQLPPELAVFNGPTPDFGGAVAGWAQTGTGLTFNAASDIAWATGSTPPATFAGCTATPAPGYDPAVTFVCINPKGAMASGDPDPAFTVRFRARIR